MRKQLLVFDQRGAKWLSADILVKVHALVAYVKKKKGIVQTIVPRKSISLDGKFIPLDDSCFEKESPIYLAGLVYPEMFWANILYLADLGHTVILLEDCLHIYGVEFKNIQNSIQDLFGAETVCKETVLLFSGE